MKELAAYLLALVGGKAGSAEDIKSICAAASVTASDDEIAAVLAAVEGKDLAALIEEGKKKLVNVGGGGGGGGGGGAPAAAAGGAAAGGAKEEKKKEEKKEEEEEVDMGGAGGLFGGGDVSNLAPHSRVAEVGPSQGETICHPSPSLKSGGRRCAATFPRTATEAYLRRRARFAPRVHNYALMAGRRRRALFCAVR